MSERATLASQFQAPLPPSIGADEQQLEIGTASLWVRRAAPTDGPTADPVIFLHPWTGSGHCWPYQEAAFVAAGHETICYSRRGHRGSDCGQAGDDANAVADLVELVDVLGLDRFHLVGSAAGAFAGAGFAIRHSSDRLASVTLACTMLNLGSIDGIRSVTAFDQWKLIPHDVRELGPSYRSVNDAGVAAWRDIQERSRGDNPTDFLQRLGGPTSLDELTQISTPTLYLAGAADLYSPPPVLEVFTEVTPGAEFAVVEGAGHSAYWERPDVFNQLVLDFISRH